MGLRCGPIGGDSSPDPTPGNCGDNDARREPASALMERAIKMDEDPLALQLTTMEDGISMVLQKI